jgi:hypothetical protein
VATLVHFGSPPLHEIPSPKKEDKGEVAEEEEVDYVNHPTHYNLDPSGIECIEIIRHRNFNVGSAIKYLWRAGFKNSSIAGGQHIEDLEKAIWYINDEIARIKGLTNN